MIPVTQTTTIKPMSAAAIDVVSNLEAEMLKAEQVDIQTVHVIHAGLYSRSIRMPAGVVLVGALVKIPTVLTISGNCSMLIDGEWIEFAGYHTVPASAGRKQVFYAHADTFITMTFKTDAQTVVQAEAEFTDEFNKLMSRESSGDIVIITGE
jgi:hypothetical protein